VQSTDQLLIMVLVVTSVVDVHLSEIRPCANVCRVLCFTSSVHSICITKYHAQRKVMDFSVAASVKAHRNAWPASVQRSSFMVSRQSHVRLLWSKLISVLIQVACLESLARHCGALTCQTTAYFFFFVLAWCSFAVLRRVRKGPWQAIYPEGALGR